jgi:hypothetical protein
MWVGETHERLLVAVVRDGGSRVLITAVGYGC